jgi:2-C-methyl-D-erythritol 4-phosphate cytidylyltransferase
VGSPPKLAVVATAAIVLAAGSGERLGGALPKAFVPLAGRALVSWSLDALAAWGGADRVLLVAPLESEDLQPLIQQLVAGYGIDAVVSGGATRQASVRAGLAAVGEASTVVCHDAARPFASPALFGHVVEALRDADGAVPVVRSPDTVKIVADGLVERTLPRDRLRLVQTPQAFRGDVLREVHERAARDGLEATDDAMLLEAAGFRVAAVEGEPGNFKVTTAEDLGRAEDVMARLHAPR